MKTSTSEGKHGIQWTAQNHLDDLDDLALLSNTHQQINPITLDGGTLENVESFTYLGSIIDEQGGSNADVKARIGKARVAFLQSRNL
ncbi:unnamed protein product [Schistosoma margrebowiei]|uniref:Uncharacterized protein n=1 Tax=Schistosoma margrebowiei TaxID=48269 RepID=A0A183LF50_9TREM|nr:unnamed protein product [Schistosoma margrebowiei]